jgi:hypothetical protein
MEKYNPDHKRVLDDMFSGHPLLRPGKMFGFPAYYVGKKMCICLYEQGVGIKLPAATVTNLLATDPNVIPFQPYGKSRMREWVQINLSRSEDYREYLSIFDEAVQHILSLQENN